MPDNSQTQGQSVSLGVLEYQIAGQFDQIERQLRDFESKMRSLKLKVELDEASLAQVTRRLQNIASRIKIDFDVSAADAKLRDVERRAARATGATPGVQAGYTPAAYPIVPAGAFGPNWTFGGLPNQPIARGGAVPPYIFATSSSATIGGAKFALPGPASPGSGSSGVIPVSARRVPGSGGFVPNPQPSEPSGGRSRFFGTPNAMALYMNLLFGGWEIAQAHRAIGLGEAMAAVAESPLDALRAKATAASQASAGPFSSIIGMGMDLLTDSGPTDLMRELISLTAIEKFNADARASMRASQFNRSAVVAMGLPAGERELAMRRAQIGLQYDQRLDQMRTQAGGLRSQLGETTRRFAGITGGDSMAGATLVPYYEDVPRVQGEERSAMINRLNELENEIKSLTQMREAELAALSRDEMAYGLKKAALQADIQTAGYAAELHLRGRHDEADMATLRNSIEMAWAQLPPSLQGAAWEPMQRQLDWAERQIQVRSRKSAIAMEGQMRMMDLLLANKPFEAEISKIQAEWDAANEGASREERERNNWYYLNKMDLAAKNQAFSSDIARQQSYYGLRRIDALMNDQPGVAQAYDIAAGVYSRIKHAERMGDLDLAGFFGKEGIGQLRLLEKQILQGGGPTSSSPWTAGQGDSRQTQNLIDAIRDLISTIEKWVPTTSS